jgi:hypothetical protein
VLLDLGTPGSVGSISSRSEADSRGIACDPSQPLPARSVILAKPNVVSGEEGGQHCTRQRKRSCNSTTDSSRCARFNPARPLLGWLVQSLSIRRSAAATRSRARSKSATVYCRGSSRLRFLRGPFAAFLAGITATSSFPVAIVPLCGYSAASAAMPCVSFGFRTQASSQLSTLKDFTNLPTPSVCAQSMPSSIISSSLKCFFSSS